MTRASWTLFTTPSLLKLIGLAAGRDQFATHRFKLKRGMEANDVFGSAAETNALQVVLEGEKRRSSRRRGWRLPSRRRQLLRRDQAARGCPRAAAAAVFVK